MLDEDSICILNLCSVILCYLLRNNVKILYDITHDGTRAPVGHFKVNDYKHFRTIFSYSLLSSLDKYTY
jgi:hypothetical protein